MKCLMQNKSMITSGGIPAIPKHYRQFMDRSKILKFSVHDVFYTTRFHSEDWSTISCKSSSIHFFLLHLNRLYSYSIFVSIQLATKINLPVDLKQFSIGALISTSLFWKVNRKRLNMPCGKKISNSFREHWKSDQDDAAHLVF